MDTRNWKCIRPYSLAGSIIIGVPYTPYIDSVCLTCSRQGKSWLCNNDYMVSLTKQKNADPSAKITIIELIMAPFSVAAAQRLYIAGETMMQMKGKEHSAE